MSKNKLENIEIVRDRRIYFSFDNEEYSINITNEGELRLSVVDGIIQILPLATNCILFKNIKE